MINEAGKLPLISVIITTYNYAGYLPKAIASVKNQTYKNVEIIIVDDGSTDHTRTVIQKDWQARYFYQENKGISAARNSGIELAKGEYILFLDADDWLETDGLEQNYVALKQAPNAAFVSGNYHLLRAKNNNLEAVKVEIQKDHYIELLKRNYIGMHATVMYRKWVLDKIKYDDTLKACEDYDLYLTIARQHPVIHQQGFIATYFFHPSSLSHNHQVMIDALNTVMKRQAPFVHSAEEKKAYEEGLQQWKDYQQLLENSL